MGHLTTCKPLKSISSKLQDFAVSTPNYISIFNEVVKGESIEQALKSVKVEGEKLKQLNMTLEGTLLP